MKVSQLQKNIPKEWSSKTIDDVCFILKGKGLSRGVIYSNGKNKCILYGQLFTTYNEVINDILSKTDSEDGILSDIGDILIPGSTTTKAEDLAIASALLEKNVLLGGDINILRPKGDYYDPVFFAYYLTHFKNKEIGKLGQGTTIIHLYGKNLKKVKLLLPTIKEQKKIAEILSKVDEEINKTDELISKTEKLKNGLVIKLFSEHIKTKKYNIKDISEITSSKRVMVSDYTDNGIPFYRSTEIIKKSKNIPITNPYYISLDKFNFFKNKFGAPEFGDILITAVGTIGDVYLVQNETFYFKDGNTIWIRKIKDIVLPEYLKMILSSNFYREKLNVIAGGSSQKALTIQKLENVEVAIPSIKEQKDLIKILSCIDNKLNLQKELKEKLTQLKKGLMSDLLSGKVRVN